MTQRSLLCVFLLAPCHLVTLSPCHARADGGTVRLSQRAGGYQITVFTAPTPLRAGPVDVSVLVQDAATGQVLPEAQVTIWVAPSGRGSAAVAYPATAEAATNKLLRSALFELPEVGPWDLEVVVEGPLGPARVRCEVEAAEPLPRWLSLWPWLTWPVLVIVLFGVHLLLVRRAGADRHSTPQIKAPDRSSQPGRRAAMGSPR